MALDWTTGYANVDSFVAALVWVMRRVPSLLFLLLWRWPFCAYGWEMLSLCINSTPFCTREPMGVPSLGGMWACRGHRRAHLYRGMTLVLYHVVNNSFVALSWLAYGLRLSVLAFSFDCALCLSFNSFHCLPLLSFAAPEPIHSMAGLWVCGGVGCEGVRCLLLLLRGKYNIKKRTCKCYFLIYFSGACRCLRHQFLRFSPSHITHR